MKTNRSEMTILCNQDFIEFEKAMNATPEKRKYINDVFRLLINLNPGQSFEIDNIVKTENIEQFIKTACLFMSERPNHDYEFSNDYTQIKRIVMPVDYAKYPANWFTEIRPRILTREENKCKKCKVSNYAVGYHDFDFWIPATGSLLIDQIGIEGAKNYQEARFLADTLNESENNKDRFIVIVLTVAHLDQDITNNKDENLAALCQRCMIIVSLVKIFGNVNGSKRKYRGMLKG